MRFNRLLQREGVLTADKIACFALGEDMQAQLICQMSGEGVSLHRDLDVHSALTIGWPRSTARHTLGWGWNGIHD